MTNLPPIPNMYKDISPEYLYYDEGGTNIWLPKIGGLVELANKNGVLNIKMDVSSYHYEPGKYSDVIMKCRAELIPTYKYYVKRMFGEENDYGSHAQDYSKFILSGGVFSAEDVGEVNERNIHLTFIDYSASVAATRAKSRAIKMMLGLTDLTFEEVKRESELYGGNISSELKAYPSSKKTVKTKTVPVSPVQNKEIDLSALLLSTSSLSEKILEFVSDPASKKLIMDVMKKESCTDLRSIPENIQQSLFEDLMKLYTETHPVEAKS